MICPSQKSTTYKIDSHISLNSNGFKKTYPLIHSLSWPSQLVETTVKKVSKLQLFSPRNISKPFKAKNMPFTFKQQCTIVSEKRGAGKSPAERQRRYLCDPRT
jgi:hypothetical protein